MPRPRKYNKSKKPNKKKQYKKNYRRNTSRMIISRPLLPQTQKVLMTYTTRVGIVPSEIHSGIVDTAAGVSTHVMSWNNLNDPDYTHGAVFTNHHADGALNHQPRMYDQYSLFYDRCSVIGAKAKITFSADNRVFLGSGHNADGAVTMSSHLPPKPMYVGYLNSTYNDNQATNAKYDDLNERKAIIKKRLVSVEKPVTVYAKWSINKEPGYKSDIVAKAESPGEWGAPFNNDIATQNQRFLHIFAHPTSINESTPDSNTVPQQVNVEIEMSYIVLLTDRKDVVQS